MTHLLHRQLGREWRQLKSDPWLFALVSWVPVVLFIFLWYIFSAGLPRDLAIGVVDLNHSQLSRSVIRHYDASPMLRVEHQFTSISDGRRALVSADINALVVIPTNMETDTRTGRSPQITVFYNAQFLLIGKLIASALLQSQGTFNVKVSALQALAQGKIGVQAIGAAVPVASQVTALFNINNNYAQFLASAIIPAIWQILIVVTAILSMSREITTREITTREITTREISIRKLTTRELRSADIVTWLGKTPLTVILAKLLPYTVIFWLHGAVFLFGMYIVLGWPMNGSWMVLLIAQLLMVIASQAMALLLFLIIKNGARALSIAAAYTAPSFAFMGITFPATDMTLPARIWRDFIPVSHYIEVQISQANHGVSALLVLPQMGYLLLFNLAFVVGFFLAKRLMKVSSKSVEISS